jgi:transposase
VSKLRTAVISGSERKEQKKDIDRFLVIESTESGRKVSVRNDVLDRALRKSGWFVLLGSAAQSVQHAVDVYRLKDVVEKGFWKYKNGLGLDRMRVHSDERAANKVFIAFIALIISCHIKNTMKKSQCCHRMTPNKLFHAIAKLKSATIGGHRVLRPLTRLQKDIFEAFDVPEPVG